MAQNGKLKKKKAEYERQRLEVENRRAEWEEKERKKNKDRFVQKDQGAMASSTALVVRSDDTEIAGRRASTAAASGWWPLRTGGWSMPPHLPARVVALCLVLGFR